MGVVLALIFFSLGIYFLIRSDLKLNHEQPVTILNWIGTNIMLFSGLGFIYFFIVVFFLKKIHPSKSNYLKAIFVPIIFVIVSFIIVVISKNII
ncbi:MAG: hypothetical protein COA66_00085 [Arcobacter sp.]|nr:MAG: hypothetical protein COA66_00085 [Arcobacter sp.]